MIFFDRDSLSARHQSQHVCVITVFRRAIKNLARMLRACCDYFHVLKFCNHFCRDCIVCMLQVLSAGESLHDRLGLVEGLEKHDAIHPMSVSVGTMTDEILVPTVAAAQLDDMPYWPQLGHQVEDVSAAHRAVTHTTEVGQGFRNVLAIQVVVHMQRFNMSHFSFVVAWSTSLSFERFPVCVGCCCMTDRSGSCGK